MSAEDKLKEKCGNDPGFRVPDGFFDSRFKEISASLPPAPEPIPAVKLSRWHRIRPYVYLAAMFAGIWCMMKMFHIMSSSPSVSLDNPPTVIAEAITTTPEVIELYSGSACSDDYSLEHSVMEEYDSFNEFESDFSEALAQTEQEIDN